MKLFFFNTILTNGKKIHFVIVFFLYSIGMSLNAQTGYQSFFGDSSTTYHVFTSLTCYITTNTGLLGCGDTYKHTITCRDTAIFNDTVYYRTDSSFWSLYIREDTNTGRLYRYFPNLNKEFLTCDMSLNVGDTFQLPLFSSDCQFSYFYEEAGIKLVVDSIVYINGKKVIYFPYIILYENNNPYPVFYSAYYDGKYSEYGIIPAFIEGIGPTFSPFVYTVHSLETDLNVMLCIEKNDTLAFMLNNQLGCYQSFVDIKEIENAKINIFPNPASDQLILDNGQEIMNEIRIFDMLGKEVKCLFINNTKTTLNITHLTKGFYFLQILTEKKIVNKRFVKE